MSRPEKIFILEPTSSSKTSSASAMISSSITDQTSQSLCRICASNTKLVLPIFEKEGLENNLAEKISKYLPIQVSQDDLLPKVVCFQCTTTILTWHELVTTCQQADTSLKKQVSLEIVNKGSEYKHSDYPIQSNSTLSFLEAVKEIILGIFSSVIVEEDCGIEFSCQKCNNQQMRYIEDLSEHLMQIHIPQTYNRKTIESFIKNHIKFEEVLCVNDDSVPCYPSRPKSGATFSCKLCERRFTSTTRLIGHLHEHTAVDLEAGVACCGRPHRGRAALARHLAAEHRAAAPATACRSCAHLAPGPAALRAHVRAAHVVDRPGPRRTLGPNNQKRIPAACPLCGKIFSNKYNMAVHARGHGGERRAHACDVCGRRYSTRGNLAAHAAAAHRAPALACPACGELFARRSELRRHEARHGPAALRCPACPASFHHADSLRRHLLAHRDARPHACPRCGRAFRQHSHLAAHRASHACRLLQGPPAD